MITRLVKITLRPDEVNNFLEIFKEVKETIASFDGCHHVELLQDLHAPYIFSLTASGKTSIILINTASLHFLRILGNVLKCFFQPKRKRGA